jgi:hypothetical protein
MIPREHLTFHLGYANTPFVLEGDKTTAERDEFHSPPRKIFFFLSFSPD